MIYFKHFFKNLFFGTIASFAVILLFSIVIDESELAQEIFLGLTGPGRYLDSALGHQASLLGGHYGLMLFSSIVYGFFIALFGELLSRDA